MTTTPDPQRDDISEDDVPTTAHIMTFNANDPSGAAGLCADLSAIASAGLHVLPIVTGAYIRDTAQIIDHVAFDDEAVTDQARTVLEDVPVHIFKVGFVGSPENLSAIAELASDYDGIPMVTYMPDLSWWEESKIEAYQDACKELLLPQTTVLIGNYGTLARWLLPDWNHNHSPSTADITKAAHALGVPYTLVTGITLPTQFIDNELCTPESVVASHQFERIEAVFTGAGETLSAAVTALIAAEGELTEAVKEALEYLDECLENGYRPGMGHVLPDRFFWAQTDGDDSEGDDSPENSVFNDINPNATRH